MFSSPDRCTRCNDISFLSKFLETDDKSFESREQQADFVHNIQQHAFFYEGSFSLQNFKDDNCHTENHFNDLINGHKIIKILRKGGEENNALAESEKKRGLEIGQQQSLKICWRSKSPFRKPQVMNNELMVPTSNSDECSLPHVVDSLSHAVMKSRENQWKAADALYQSEDMIGIEQSKVENIKEKKVMTGQSLEERREQREKNEHTMKMFKEESLSNKLDIVKRLPISEKKLLTDNQPILLCDKANLTKEIPLRKEFSAVVEKESGGIDVGTQQTPTDAPLEEKEGQVIQKPSKKISIEKGLFAFPNDSSLYVLKADVDAQVRERVSKINNTDSYLTFILRRSEKLEEDRQVLLLEMKDLLSKAGLENEKLRDEVLFKDNKFYHLNGALEKTKLGLGLLVSETFDFYKDAKSNIKHLKKDLRLKEKELAQSKLDIGYMNIAYENLLHENQRELLKSSKLDHSSKCHLQVKDEELYSARNQLFLMKERENLIQVAKSELEAKIRLGAEVQDHFRREREDIRNEHAKTARELGRVKSILKNADTKESLARAELENILADLVNRAESAETDHQKLKVQIEMEAQLLKLLQETEDEATRSFEGLIAAITKNKE